MYYIQGVSIKTSKVINSWAFFIKLINSDVLKVVWVVGSHIYGFFTFKYTRSLVRAFFGTKQNAHEPKNALVKKI